MKMTIGKFKGQPVEAMETRYLAWFISQDHIRFRYFPLVEAALRELLSRDPGDMLRELRVLESPNYSRTSAEIERRAAQKAEKLRRLVEQRAELRGKKFGGHALPQSVQPEDVLVDAHFYVKNKDDFSDLI